METYKIVNFADEEWDSFEVNEHSRLEFPYIGNIVGNNYSTGRLGVVGQIVAERKGVNYEVRQTVPEQPNKVRTFAERESAIGLAKELFTELVRKFEI